MTRVNPVNTWNNFLYRIALVIKVFPLRTWNYENTSST